MQFRRKDRATAKNIAEYNLIRRKAKSEMVTCSGFPEQCVSVLRMQNAGLSRQEKSLASGSSHKYLEFADVAANMRRLFGCRGERPAKTSWPRRARLVSREAMEIRGRV